MSVLVNRFVCPICSTQTELELNPPLLICCPKCRDSFHIDASKKVTSKYLLKFEDDSIPVITIGATGKYENEKFNVVGHLRVVNSISVSNEWYLKFHSGKEMWLVENCFEYFLLDAKAESISGDIIRFSGVGSDIVYQDQEYLLQELSKKVKIKFDGQVPEDVVPEEDYFQYEACSRKDGSLISIVVYDRTSIELFRSKKINLQELELSTLTQFKNWL